MRCPNCGTNNPPEEQLTYCRSCGAELRVVCPRCTTDNAADEEYCRECGLDLRPDRAEESQAAGIRRGAAPGEEPWLSRHAQLILGGIVVAAVLWIPIVNNWRQKTQFTTCQHNLGKIALAMQLYVRDSDNTFPLAENWAPTMLRYLKDTKYMACPSRPAKVGYDFNSNLSGQSLILSPGADAITFFEASGSDANLSGTDFEWLRPPVHSRGNNVALFSGTVRVLREPPELTFWAPNGLTQPTPAPTATPLPRPKGERKGDGPDASSEPDTSSGSATGVPPDTGPGAPAGATSANPTLPPQPGATSANPTLPPQPGATSANPTLPPQSGATSANPTLPPQPGATRHPTSAP